MDENELFYGWLSGFIDGEGCFALKISESRTARIGFKITPCFQIGLSDVDGAVLKETQKKIGGKIYHLTKEQTAKHLPYMRAEFLHGKDTLTLTNEEEFMNLIRILEKHPLKTKKKEEFKIWRTAIELCYNGQKWSKEKALEYCRLRDELHGCSNSVPRRPNKRYRPANEIEFYLSKL